MSRLDNSSRTKGPGQLPRGPTYPRNNRDFPYRICMGILKRYLYSVLLRNIYIYIAFPSGLCIYCLAKKSCHMRACAFLRERGSTNFSTLVCSRVGVVAPKVLKVIGYVLSIAWKAHGLFFAIKTTFRSLVLLVLNLVVRRTLGAATRPSTTCLT